METNRTLEIIRNEIERRKNYISVTHFAEELLSFLSTLELEKPMNQEGLEEEIQHYWLEQKQKGEIIDGSIDDYITVQDVANHFAQWGAEQERSKPEKPGMDNLEEEIMRYRCDTNGDFKYTRTARHFAKWQKEQMMKEAIPCKVFWHDGPLLDYTQEQQDNALERIGANVGDKVRIIIVKED